MSYSITFSKHNILFGASIKKCFRLVTQYTGGDIFGFKNDSGFIALRVFGFTGGYIQYIRRSSESPRTFIDSDIRYLHLRFRIQNLGRRDENWTFSFPFFKFTTNLCVKTEKRIWNKLL